MHFQVPRLAFLGWCSLVAAILPLCGQTGTAWVEHAPDISGRVEGSIHQLRPESVALGGSAVITGDVLVPGTPSVRLNGKPSYGGTLEGEGPAEPSNFQVSIAGNSVLRHVVRRTPAVTLPAVSAPPTPSGTRSVTVTSSAQSPGDFAALRDLTVGGSAGPIAIPPGTYGVFSANAGAGFTLGTAGATQPAHYSFQRLSLAGQSELRVLGPVIVTILDGFTAAGLAGNPTDPLRLELRIAAGGVTLNGNAVVAANLVAPNGAVVLNGASQFAGAVACDRLTIGGAAVLRLVAPPVVNQLPQVAMVSPAGGAVIPSYAPVLLTATARDPDGSITKLEFSDERGQLGVGVPTQPGTYACTLAGGLVPGTYRIAARATDDHGAVAESAAVAITVLATLPYTADFEAAEGYVAGSLNGQIGWRVSGGTATIEEDSAYSGRRSVRLAAGTTLTQVAQTFAPLAGEPVIFVELFARPVADPDLDAATSFQADGARFALRREADRGIVSVFSGNGGGGGLWQPTPLPLPLNPDGSSTDWIRFTVRLDFAAGRWDLYANGILAASDVGFSDSARTALGSVVLRGHPTIGSRFDYLFAAPTNPLFADADRDGLDDAWELQNGLSPSLNDRAGDLDGDGLSNLREFQLGTRANAVDSDNDGMPDGWEVQFGLNPRLESASADSDGDGLTDGQEFAAGTNPVRADTDDDGMRDGWEMANGLNPKLASDAEGDADGDGRTNLQEFQAGTDPNDYYNGVLPVLTSLLNPDQRPAPDGGIAIRVTRTDGTSLGNAPITFQVSSGGLMLSPVLVGASWGTNAMVRSDSQGIARVYVTYPVPAQSVNTLVATARSGAQSASLLLQLAPPISDLDGDGLHDPWEIAQLGTLDYRASDDPGGVGRTLLQSQQQNLNAWPAATVAAGLQVWYRADLGVVRDATSNRVSRWTDVSGHGVHASQAAAAAQPRWIQTVFGAMPAVRFDGLGTILRSSAVDVLQGSSDLTIFVTVSAAPSQVTYADILDHNHGTPPYGGFVVQQNVDALNQYGLLWRNLTNDGWVGSGGVVPIAAGTRQLLVLRKSGTTQSGFLEGTQKFSVAVPNEMLANPPRVLCVGGFGAGGRYFRGDVAEILIYNRALSDAERAQVEAAMTARCVDADGNGLPDTWELAHFGSIGIDPTADADRDGLTNRREFELGTDPLSADTDADGLPDAWEVGHGSNPNLANGTTDADGDSLSTLAEYVLGTDPLRAAIPDSGDTINLRVYRPRD